MSDIIGHELNKRSTIYDPKMNLTPGHDKSILNVPSIDHMTMFQTRDALEGL